MSTVPGKELTHIMKFLNRSTDENLPTTKELIIQRIILTKHRWELTENQFLVQEKKLPEDKIKELIEYPTCDTLIREVIEEREEQEKKDV